MQDVAGFEEAVVALHRDGEVLFLRRTKDDAWPDDPWEGLWWLPGGRVESNETPAAAAIREVAEEAGFILDEVNYVTHAIDRLPTREVCRIHLFVAAAPGSEPVLNDEHDAWRWGSPEEFFEQDLTHRADQSALFAGWIPAARTLIEATARYLSS